MSAYRAQPDGEGSAAAARAEQRAARGEARAQAVERERPEHEAREKPDWLGLRFDRPELGVAERYGLHLMEPGTIEHLERLKEDVDRMAARAEALASRERPDRPAPAEAPWLSCSVGPALGVGPSVSLDGKNDLGFSLITNLPSMILPESFEYSMGSATGPDGRKELTVSTDFGFNAPAGVARVAVGVTVNTDRAEGLGVYAQGRVLGLACRIDLTAKDAADAFDTGHSWYNDALRRIGYPAP